VAGKTAILTAPSVLHINVTSNIIVSGNAIKLLIEDLENLHNYVPFSRNININDRLRIFAPAKEFEPVKENDDDRYIVERIIKEGSMNFSLNGKVIQTETTLWNLLQTFLMTL